MSIKKLLFTIGCFVFGAMIFVIWFTKKTYNSSRVSISWSYEGQPYVVMGSVVDQKGKPVPDLFIDLETDSGGVSAFTDEYGTFIQRVDHPELIGIELGKGAQKEAVFFRPVMGLRLDEGIAFDIKFKSPPPGASP